MKIGILLNPYGEKNPAGLARIIFELTKALIANDTQNEYIVCTKEKSIPKEIFSGSRWKSVVLGGGFLWLDRGFSRMKDADVVIFNTPILPFFRRPRRSVVIALDFAYQFFPSHSVGDYIKRAFLKWYHGHSLRTADMIIAISEATKRDIINIYGMPAEKIRVIYCGFKNICALSGARITAPEDFFLFIGALKERKNVAGVIRAFALYHKKNPLAKERLLIVGYGAGAYREELERIISEEKIGELIMRIGQISDEQLSFLYQKARALVFPSFIEGFGFPVLEAMACGLPVITSNSSSLAELGAHDSAILIDPKNQEAIAEAMRDVVHNAVLRSRLIANGKKRADYFSWEKMAKEFLAIIHSNK
ncbi:MAG: glycosyltransferase family 1 protein [Patescibacteria group bacterium]